MRGRFRIAAALLAASLCTCAAGCAQTRPATIIGSSDGVAETIGSLPGVVSTEVSPNAAKGSLSLLVHLAEDVTGEQLASIGEACGRFLQTRTAAGVQASAALELLGNEFAHFRAGDDSEVSAQLDYWLDLTRVGFARVAVRDLVEDGTGSLRGHADSTDPAATGSPAPASAPSAGDPAETFGEHDVDAGEPAADEEGEADPLAANAATDGHAAGPDGATGSGGAGLAQDAANAPPADEPAASAASRADEPTASAAEADSVRRYVGIDLPDDADAETAKALFAAARALADPGAVATEWEVTGFEHQVSAQLVQPRPPDDAALDRLGRFAQLIEDLDDHAFVSTRVDPAATPPASAAIALFDPSLEGASRGDIEARLASSPVQAALEAVLAEMDSLGADYSLSILSNRLADGGNFDLEVSVEDCVFAGDATWPEESRTLAEGWLRHRSAVDPRSVATGRCSVAPLG